MVIQTLKHKQNTSLVDRRIYRLCAFFAKEASISRRQRGKGSGVLQETALFYCHFINTFLRIYKQVNACPHVGTYVHVHLVCKTNKVCPTYSNLYQEQSGLWFLCMHTCWKVMCTTWIKTKSYVWYLTWFLGRTNLLINDCKCKIKKMTLYEEA